MISIRHVLFSTAHSPGNKSLKKQVIGFCKGLGASLHTLHVVMAYAHGESSSQTEAASTAICTFAKSHPIDLIIMGPHGRTGFPMWLLDSVAESVVDQASCPVMIPRADDGPVNLQDIRPILVPEMSDQACKHTLTQALQWAGVFKAKLHVLGILPPPTTQSLGIEPDKVASLKADLRQQLADLESTHGFNLSADIQVGTGKPSRDMLDFANRYQIDPILLGHRQSDGTLESLSQKMAQKILHHPTRPIVATPLPKPEQAMVRTH